MHVSVAAIEQATGLDREVLRKWERRYGFPQPTRDANGERAYPEEQVSTLCLIRKLMDTGLRPAKLVGLAPHELRTLVQSLAPSDVGADESFPHEALAALRRRDATALAALFQRHINKTGSLSFVLDKLAPLNVAVGDAWFRGELQIYEEHLYTEAVQEVLKRAIAVMAPMIAPPRVLLTTPSGELHALGLTMAELFFRQSGVYCVSLGTETPVAEICKAVEELDIDIVGLSISLALPKRKAAAFIRELSETLRPQTKIWVGGMGATRLPRPLLRVVPVLTFRDAERELDAWLRRLETQRQ